MNRIHRRAYVWPVGLAVAAAVAAWMWWPANESRALRCPNRTIEENFERADIVMTGTVAIVLPGQPYVRVMVTPMRVYKGQPMRATTILAHDANSPVDGASGQGDLQFASDQPPYLLFLRATEGGYLTSRCDGSRLLGSGLTASEQAVLE